MTVDLCIFMVKLEMDFINASKNVKNNFIKKLELSKDSAITWKLCSPFRNLLLIQNNTTSAKNKSVLDSIAPISKVQLPPTSAVS